jgi:diguanylate cyclase (GGDEF)-like protein
MEDTTFRSKMRNDNVSRAHFWVRHRLRRGSPGVRGKRARLAGGTLTSINGERPGSSVDIFATAVVGRSAECDVRIEDPSVSRRHARIVRDDEKGYVLHDLGSRNGTTIRGLRITRHRLADGDVISFGPATFRFGLARDRIARAEGEPLPSTGRERLDDCLVRELAEAKRCESDLWLLMLGVDPMGPMAGAIDTATHDSVLGELAATVDGALRNDDRLVRLSSSQFAIIAREPTATDPLGFAERIRRLVQKTRFGHDARPFALTVSVGVAALGDCRHPSADQLLRLADAGLYAAQIAGRNCCKRSPGSSRTRQPIVDRRR